MLVASVQIRLHLHLIRSGCMSRRAFWHCGSLGNINFYTILNLSRPSFFANDMMQLLTLRHACIPRKTLPLWSSTRGPGSCRASQTTTAAAGVLLVRSCRHACQSYTARFARACMPVAYITFSRRHNVYFAFIYRRSTYMH